MKGKSFVLASLLGIVVLTLLPMVRAQENLTPAPTGPYQIGTVTYHWIDDSREETLTPEDGDQREVVVQFWYPAEVTEGQNAASYISNSEVVVPAMESVMRDVGLSVTIASEDFVGYQSHAVVNAPLAEGEETFPVLLFSPGNLSMPEIYAAQLEELASQGYIVAGINHPYISTITFLSDGRTAMFAGANQFKTSAIVTQDQIFVLDQLEILNADDPEDVFTSRLDLDHIGLFGHSLGGGASVQTCGEDSRCKATANEDGVVNGTVAIDGFDQPYMFLSNEEGVFDPGRSYMVARGPAYALGITGMQHVSFSDFPLWPPSTLTIDPVILGEIEPERSVQIVRTYLLAFFDTYLKGETSDLLAGASDDYPEVKIQMRNT